MPATVSQGRTDVGLPVLQLHIEPERPLELEQLTAELGALARQYSKFVEQDNVLGRGASARLLVSSVKPGSIDIGLFPDWQALAGVLATAYDPLQHLVGFAEQIRKLLGFFETKKG